METIPEFLLKKRTLPATWKVVSLFISSSSGMLNGSLCRTPQEGLIQAS